MYLQLNAIVADLHAAERRLQALRQHVPVERWSQRPAPERWSPAECVAHLNLTSEAFLPLLRKGLAEAKALPPSGSRRYRRDLIGWIVWRVVTPAGTFRTKTPPAFVPTAERPADALIGDFSSLQAALVALVTGADGLALDRVRITSPFDSRARYNVYAALTIIPRHQQRHLRQAEQAAGVHGVIGT